MLDINLNLYKVFYIVAQSKSFSDASFKLNITTTAISKNINNLENLLNVKLFTREVNGVKLTDAGNELFKYVDKSMTTIDLGEKLVLQNNDLTSGEITIGCPSHISAFYLMNFIKDFNKDYPNVNINIIGGADGTELIQLLENHKIDFIIDNTKTEIQHNNIIVQELKEIPNIFISKEPIKINDMKELEKYKYILPFQYTSTCKKLVECLNKYNVCLNTKMSIDITELRINAVKDGLGIGYVMEDAAKEDIKSQKLYKVEIPVELPKSSIRFIYNEGLLTIADKKFIKKYLKK